MPDADRVKSGIVRPADLNPAPQQSADFANVPGFASEKEKPPADAEKLAAAKQDAQDWKT